jgi:hypothetical protein
MNDSLSTIATSLPSGFRKFWHLKSSPPGGIGNCAVVTVTEGRTGGGGGGGGAASGAPVLVGNALGDELGTGPVLGTEVGMGPLDGGADGVVLGCGAGWPTVVHCFAQKAVSWCSQKHRSMQVTQLAHAGICEQPGASPFGAPAPAAGPDENGSLPSLDPPPAEHPTMATRVAGMTKCRMRAIRTV